MIDRMVIATKNPHKLSEMRAIIARLWPTVTLIDDLEWDDIDETGDTLEENALLKARAVAGATGHAALADDTGLEVDALGGRPGVHSARFAGVGASFADNRALLLEELGGVSERGARFRTVVALVAPDGFETVAEGVVDGVITTEERGAGGFGYDPVFEIGGMTLAEMAETEKNLVSHRALAVEALVRSLAG